MGQRQLCARQVRSLQGSRETARPCPTIRLVSPTLSPALSWAHLSGITYLRSSDLQWD